ncbi:hypothetical protein I4Q36_00180 [Tuanshanicoccus lijuaniae]|uniref:hypothetical protein n=1 Tax=Aerococcaceae bacterium zg-1292 TaxID=2774330 RepID=UPI00193534BA|nr:hypothetical protein [Aerococcaceae bacterium zg-1292]MBF6625397.1 hypothetical protein [Aerococcaceae bacterium zg-BR9]MBF6979058.1 hypothetical protein [Aerococcaceae bacterium zg-BR22]MBS4456371.1 hypothetical protein [Aerococcaceae bacterium zg-A91]MBS4458213.1 hypothetical protein [Aerococcaceae bacterium zg-BR33]
MNQTLKKMLIFLMGLAIGGVLMTRMRMLYFIGCILIYIISMGNNRISLQNIGKNQQNTIANQQWLWGMIGYIIAGFVMFFIQK